MLVYRCKSYVSKLFVCLFVCLLSACGSSKDDSDDDVPISGPKSIQAVGYDGRINVTFDNFGETVQGVVPTYEVRILKREAGAQCNDPEHYNTETHTMTNDGLRLSSLNINEYANAALENGQEYCVWARGNFRQFGYSAWSLGEVAMPVPALDAAQLGTIQTYPGDGLTYIKWDEVPYASAYEVKFSQPVAGSPFGENKYYSVLKPEVIVVVKPVNDNDLNTRVTISPINSNNNVTGFTATTQSVTITTSKTVVATAAPSTPTGVAVTPGNKRLTVSWDAANYVANGVNAASGYIVSYGTGACDIALPEMAPATGRVQATIPELTNGTMYQVCVTAKNSFGSSAATAAVSGTPAESTLVIDYNNSNFSLGMASAEFPFVGPNASGKFYAQPVADMITRSREAATGDLFSDGLKWWADTYYPDEEVDFAFLHGAYIYNKIGKGEVTLGDIQRTVDSGRWKDTVSFISLTGEQLIRFMDQVAKQKNMGYGKQKTGGFGMPSKEFRYSIRYMDYYNADGNGTAWEDLYLNDAQAVSGPNEETPSNPHSNDGKVAMYFSGKIEPGTLKVNGVAIDPAKTYRIVTINYLADGSGGITGTYYESPIGSTFDVLLEAAERVNTTTPAWHAVAQYVAEQGVIDPVTDGRVTILCGIPFDGEDYYCPAAQ